MGRRHSRKRRKPLGCLPCFAAGCLPFLTPGTPLVLFIPLSCFGCLCRTRLFVFVPPFALAFTQAGVPASAGRAAVRSARSLAAHAVTVTRSDSKTAGACPERCGQTADMQAQKAKRRPEEGRKAPSGCKGGGCLSAFRPVTAGGRVRQLSVLGSYCEKKDLTYRFVLFSLELNNLTLN